MWNMEDENEILFSSWIQRQYPLDDVDLTGVHVYYDMAHELGRGMFATVAPARVGSRSSRLFMCKWAARRLVAFQLFDIATLPTFHVAAEK